jgi:hypothetical protein
VGVLENGVKWFRGYQDQTTNDSGNIAAHQYFFFDAGAIDGWIASALERSISPSEHKSIDLFDASPHVSPQSIP